MEAAPFRSAVESYLHDGEALVETARLDGGWLALTDRRLLVYAAHRDALVATPRANVVAVGTGTHVGAVRGTGVAPRLALYGLVAVGAGVAARTLRGTFAVVDSVPDSAPGVGPLLAAFGLLRSGLATVAALAVAGGLLAVLVAAAIGLRWLDARREAVVVETLDGAVRLPGDPAVVDETATTVADHLEERPDPADLLA
jgi:hypothetical protein